MKLAAYLRANRPPGPPPSRARPVLRLHWRRPEAKAAARRRLLRAAFETAARDNSWELACFARKYAGEDDWRDCLQGGLLGVWRILGRFDPGRGTLDAFFRVRAMYAMRTWIRLREGQCEAARMMRRAAPLVESSAALSSHEALSDARMDVAAGLRLLSPLRRAVIAARYLYGLSPHATARLVGRTRRRTAAIEADALARLRRAMI